MNMSLAAIMPTDLAFHTHDLSPVAAERLASFQMRIIKAVATSDDGLCVIEFDARSWLERASDDDLIKLLDDWCAGDGPACRRVLERHSRDTQAFLAYTEQHRQSWVLNVDARAVSSWVEARKPFLVYCIDEEMITG